MLSDEKRLRLAELAEAGMSVRQIAEALNVAPSTVTRNAKVMGVAFDRSATERATAARVADASARRAEMAVRLLELTSAELDRLARPHRVYAFVGGPSPQYMEHVLPQPDPSARLAIAQTAATLLDRHARLVAMQSDTSTDDARSMIGRLQEALGAYYEQTQGAAGTEDAAGGAE
ncbi:helix-turn-helix domain-containing protein [Streptomyces sp. TP-A0356]|uniref:helix-turn-helix domain-containing protein n=1 Tax=Streptomyces sp. TP-A0356 TaxID=1359208 RepID=UPI0006E3B07E|nr:helix-turn-helix domain-containing protein [Streptomyces sp. TP-A0356]